MRVVIKDASGKVIYSATAKTSRGFNAKQRAEILKARTAIGLPVTRQQQYDRLESKQHESA